MTVRQEMDFNLFVRWSNQSEFICQAFNLSSNLELSRALFSSAIFRVCSYSATTYLSCIVYATCLNNNGISVVSTDYYD